MNLPIEYKNRMHKILKNEYDKFLLSYEKPCFRGLRVNTLKISVDRFKSIFPYKISSSSFSFDNFYLVDEVESIGTTPLHHAGAFYVQEPSASSAVTILDVKPFDIVLDLCAAPGGKATQIASRLNGEGLIWANEVISSRARILLSNIERMGVRNSVVSSCHPGILCSKLKGFFDKILVDAPCSGEGMFRKNINSISEWSLEHVAACAKRQLEILNSAAQALKKDGTLVYSTCTFSVEENENVVKDFLKLNEDFIIEKIQVDFGRPAFNLKEARRIFPLDGGEGHFIAKFRKVKQTQCNVKNYNFKARKNKDNILGEKLFKEIFNISPYGVIKKIDNKFFVLPKNLPDLNGVNVLRAGVLLGCEKGSILEPAHAAFMASSCRELNNVVSLSSVDFNAAAFLRGEEINISEELKGYTGVCLDGLVSGFGKASKGRLKNKYPKGLRNNR